MVKCVYSGVFYFLEGNVLKKIIDYCRILFYNSTYFGF